MTRVMIRIRTWEWTDKKMGKWEHSLAMTVIIMVVTMTECIKGNDTTAVVVVYNIDVVVDKDKNNDGDIC